MKKRTVGAVAAVVDGTPESGAVDEAGARGASLGDAASLRIAPSASFWVGAEGGADADGSAADGAAVDGADPRSRFEVAPRGVAGFAGSSFGLAAFGAGVGDGEPSARANAELAISPAQTTLRTTPGMLREYSEGWTLTTPRT